MIKKWLLYDLSQQVHYLVMVHYLKATGMLHEYGLCHQLRPQTIFLCARISVVDPEEGSPPPPPFIFRSYMAILLRGGPKTTFWKKICCMNFPSKLQYVLLSLCC